MTEVKAPWLKSIGDMPASIEYFDGSMYEAVHEIAKKYPELIAYDFMGSNITYKQFIRQVMRCARALRNIGIVPGDRVTIIMPNAPQTLIMFYAVNMIGAVSNMVHPLSSEKEIEFYISFSKSRATLALDQTWPRLEKVLKNIRIPNLIISGIGDGLAPAKRAAFSMVQWFKGVRIPDDAPVVRWPDFIKAGDGFKTKFWAKRNADDPAAILYSGGTTGKNKGIALSNYNFNALAAQIVAVNEMFRPGDKMLAVMPMFHGFGLGVSIHSMLANGGHCILIPIFNAESYAELLKKHQPNFIAGVPTLYEALLRLPSLDDVDLSCLKGVFSGGDSLSIELKKRFDEFLAKHNAHIKVREGYGTTECVTASCLTPPHMAKVGSIGIPFPDTFYKIVKPGTAEEVPYGEEGEICLSGPTVMLGYVDEPEETANTLRRHKDGMLWLHTGDLGMMDDEGFIYFRQRIKRMIVTSGYNVYPSQIENILDANDFVHMSCVIGIPDPYKMQRVKAFVVLKPGFKPSEEIEAAILAYCEKHVAKYAMPKEIEFRESLPKTLVGKVAYRELEAEEAAKREKSKAE